MNKALIIGILGVVGIILYRKYQLVKNIAIDFAGIDFLSFSPFRAQVQFAISNPTSGNATINAVHGYITSNGRNLATVDVNREVVIYPNTNTIVPVDVNLVDNQLLNIGLSWINKGGGDITFQGSIVADGITIPITQTVYNV